MPRKISKSDREVQLSALALADGYHFVGWVGEYKNSFSRTVMKCHAHGEWNVTVTNFVDKGSRCRACTGNYIYTRAEREIQLNDEKHTFVQWVDGYTNNQSKAVISCAEHGEWTVTVAGFVRDGSRCLQCSGMILRTASERVDQLSLLATMGGYHFVEFPDGYRNNRSKAKFRCDAHGEWITSVQIFSHDGCRCPSCASTGYSTLRAGTLYGLLSECGTMLKVGISNLPSQRYYQLRCRTPFKFSVHREIHCEDGAVPRMLERLFHNQFPSVGLTGFDGATEWRQMSPDITTWLELLK